LAGAHIFLGTGFPEGFALPPLEAMAAGCVPVGFGGLGGFEYMRNPDDVDLPGLCRPPFDLPPVAWGANGLFVSDGDVLSAGLILAAAARMAASPADHPLWERLRGGARLTAAAYSLEEREKQAARIWAVLAAE
jgi:glycosyltransferase involved in cell wall biosynthesis